MTITFTGFSGTRSISSRSGAALFRAWMHDYNFPEAAYDLLPPPSPSWTDDDPPWDIEGIILAEVETAAGLALKYLLCGALPYLSAKDGRSIAKFLRETADTRDGKVPGTMDDWTLPNDELQSSTALRELADFFDPASGFGEFDTIIKVSREGEIEADAAGSPSGDLRLAVAIHESAATVEAGR